MDASGLSDHRRLPARFAVHLILFAATLISTTAVGARLDFNFRHNLPAVDLDRDLLVFLDIWIHPAQLLDGLPYSITLLLILLAHEFGHYLACVYHDIECSLPYFIPAPTLIGTFGAFIRFRSPVNSRRQLFDVGIAGPLAGFLFLLPAMGIGLAYSKVVPGLGSLGEITFGHPLLLKIAAGWLFPGVPLTDLALHPVAHAAWVGLLATALNLIPIGQLDGGHMVYALFGERHTYLSMAGTLALVPLGLSTRFYGWLFLAAVMLFFGRRHFVILDDSPAGKGRWALFVVTVLVFVLSFTAAPVR